MNRAVRVPAATAESSSCPAAETENRSFQSRSLLIYCG